MPTYFAYTTNVSNYDEGDDTYTMINDEDDWATTIPLANPFVFNGNDYSNIYINSNGLINFTNQTGEYHYDNITQNYAGFYLFGADLVTNDLPEFIRYKEFSDRFVMIYNNHFFNNGNEIFQVKITLYLKNHPKSGDVVADFGSVINSNDVISQFGISFGTGVETNIIQGVNFLEYTSSNPYVFTYPNSPNQNVTTIQSNYSNKQFIITITKPPCFKEDTQILTDQGYKLIQDLRKGDLVKTLKHGFVPIDLIGKKEMYHPALQERIKDQLYQCSQDDFDEVFEPLILTGCHSILIDKFISEEQKEKAIELNSGRLCITDGKYRLPACADLRTSVYPVPGTYTIYHLALEHSDYYMNYGIYANGLLVETCSKRYLKELSNMELIE
jgi:hypothetical protein